MNSTQERNFHYSRLLRYFVFQLIFRNNRLYLTCASVSAPIVAPAFLLPVSQI
jgi:hypothetical protein